MNKNDVIARLNEVFRDVFGDDSITVNASTTAADIDDWDSIEHINLMEAVEQEFGLRFKMREVSGMKNVGEMIDIICERGTKQCQKR
ncbi:MAG: acyl carrier protein [Ruminococcus sp.]|nr:acyl carrier protein [Ruminococcus sp.]